MPVRGRKSVGTGTALALGCLGLLASSSPAAAQTEPLQATLEPAAVIQFNTVYFTSIDECFDVDGSGEAGEVAVTILRDGGMVAQVAGQVEEDGSWTATYIVPFNALLGDYTVETVCSPNGQPAPVVPYAEMTFTVEVLAKDLRSTLTPMAVRPGQDATYTSVDPCPLAFSEPGAYLTVFLNYLGPNGWSGPTQVPFPEDGRYDLQLMSDGHWRLDFSVPRVEGVYTVTAACWSNFIPGQLGRIVGLYPAPKFTVDRRASTTTTTTTTTTQPSPPPPTEPATTSPDDPPPPVPAPPARAVPGRPHLVG
jgi:hypothetical protein